MVFLPRKGYKCLTVNEKVHREIKTRAEATNRTMKEYVEYLLAKDKAERKGN